MEIRYFTRRRMKNGTFHESGVDQKYIYWYSNGCTHMLSVFTILFSECCREIIRSKRSQGNTVGIIVLDRRRCAHETADQPGDTVLVSCITDGTFYDPDTDIWILFHYLDIRGKDRFLDGCMAVTVSAVLLNVFTGCILPPPEVQIMANGGISYHYHAKQASGCWQQQRYFC